MSPMHDDLFGDGAAEHTPYEVLLGEVDHVLAEWRSLVRSESWAELPPSRLMDSMPEIFPQLIRLASTGAVQVDDRLKERIAWDHGCVRREDDVPIDGVIAEWSALKRACRQVLARSGIVNGEAENALTRIDHLIDDAVGYTLRGYYREELDSLRGRGLERRERGGDRRRIPSDRRQAGDDV